MTATKMKDLYSQLVCPSNFFNSYDHLSSDPIDEITAVPKINEDGTLSFPIKLVNDISFVGVKAVVAKNGH